MSATSADWSGIDGFGFERSDVRHQIARAHRRSQRSRLSAAAEIGLPASSARGGRPEEAQEARLRAQERRPPRGVSRPRRARPRRIRSAPAASRSKATGSGSTQLSGLRFEKSPPGLGDELLGEQDRVVLQLGVGAEPALEVLRGPGVRAHVVGERRAVRRRTSAGAHTARRRRRSSPTARSGRAATAVLVGLHLAVVVRVRRRALRRHHLPGELSTRTWRRGRRPTAAGAGSPRCRHAGRRAGRAGTRR